MKLNIVDIYYEWLLDIVRTKNPQYSYSLMLRDLHKKNFRWSVSKDDNREFEAKALRETFCEDSDIDYSEIDLAKDATMLEIFIVMAIKCYSIMDGSKDNMPISEWFWKLINNVGLLDCTDEWYNNIGVADFVDLKLERIIDRQYSSKGKGGLFPLAFTKKDQRKVELFYQMHEYLLENYYPDD